MARIACVFGSGNMLNPQNFVGRARVQHLFKIRGSYSRIAFFGCHQPSMTDTDDTEAGSALLYYTETLTGVRDELVIDAQLALGDDVSIHGDAAINSFYTTCVRIMEEYVRHGHEVVIIVNAFYMPRVKFYMKRAAKEVGLSWSAIKGYITFSPCENMFDAFLDEEGIAFIPRFIKGVLLREAGGWFQALVLAPLGINANKNRTARGI